MRAALARFLTQLAWWIAPAPCEPHSDAEMKELEMAVSAAFQTALDALTAAWSQKVAAVQAELDALKAVPPVVDTGPEVDAEDTAAVVAATPAAS